MEWHIGLSGFHYKEWKDSFYPAHLPQRLWFDYYCQHFNTLELNSSFYRFPQVHILKGWFDKSPKDFRFSVKAPKAITHFKQFRDCGEMLSSFYETINEGLQEKLGPVLFQLPPSYAYQPDRLERIISSIDPRFKNVLEFRHISWWNEDVFRELTLRQITFCGQSHPKLPDDDAIANTSVLYYRFHGVPDLYKSAYSDEFLQRITEQIKQSENVREAWIYFNNTMTTVAIENAKTMSKLTTHSNPADAKA